MCETLSISLSSFQHILFLKLLSEDSVQLPFSTSFTLQRLWFTLQHKSVLSILENVVSQESVLWRRIHSAKCDGKDGTSWGKFEAKRSRTRQYCQWSRNTELPCQGDWERQTDQDVFQRVGWHVCCVCMCLKWKCCLKWKQNVSVINRYLKHFQLKPFLRVWNIGITQACLTTLGKPA